MSDEQKQPPQSSVCRSKFEIGSSSSSQRLFPEESSLSLCDRWEKEKKAELKNVESYRARCTSDKTELFQLLGFYAVFQGVVFSAVVNSPILRCQTSLLPATLSLLAYIATAVGAHVKLTDYALDKKKIIESENVADYVSRKIRRLEDAEKRRKSGGNLDYDHKTEEFPTRAWDKQEREDEARRRKYYLAVMYITRLDEEQEIVRQVPRKRVLLLDPALPIGIRRNLASLQTKLH